MTDIVGDVDPKTKDHAGRESTPEDDDKGGDISNTSLSSAPYDPNSSGGNQLPETEPDENSHISTDSEERRDNVGK